METRRRELNAYKNWEYLMQIQRVKNASRNMLYGTALQILKLAVPFAMRTAMLYLLGVEYLGLNSLFTSVLSVLNLAELGVGSAMVYSMYEPIAEDNIEKICALMRLYKIYYRMIGCVVCVLGLILLPFIPKLINGDIPADINIYILYLLNLTVTVFSYWLFAYKSSILQAYQRNDIISKASLISESVKYAMQFFALAVFRNYYLYVLVSIVIQVFNNILTAAFAERMYPRCRACGTLDKLEQKAINLRIRDLFTAKIGTVVVYSSDTIVISAFLGLTALAVYQNYYYLFTAVASLLTIIFTSVRAGLGNSIIVDRKEKLFSDFKKFLFIIMWLAGFCSACFLCLYQPFMELWVGADLLMDFGVVICMVVYFFVHCLNTFLNSYKDASGMWHEDRFRPLVEAGINLFLNLLLVRYIGLYGIVLSTILSMLAVAPWLIHNLFRVIFDKSCVRPFLKRLGYYVFVSAVAVVISYSICTCIHLPLVYTVLIRLAVCMICTNLVLFAFYFKLPEFRQCLILLDRMTNGKIGIFHRLRMNDNGE